MSTRCQEKVGGGMNNYTAKQVRATILVLNYLVPSNHPAIKQLEAFAATLEARERAEPVGTLTIDKNGDVQTWRVDRCAALLPLGVHKLYTHPPQAASVPDGFLAHVRDVCFAAEALCQPRPRRNFEDSIEHDGAACLAGLTRIANDIDRMIVATPQDAGAPIDALTKALAQAHARSVAAEAKAAEYETRDL